jgi:hypothetical protein
VKITLNKTICGAKKETINSFAVLSGVKPSQITAADFVRMPMG